MKRNDEKSEILAAYSLDALTDDEARELAAEIADDRELAAEIEEWREVASSLAFATAPTEPSASVRENILAAIRKTPQNSNSESGAAATEKSNVVQKPAQKSNVVNFPARAPQTSSVMSYVPWLGAVAASIVAVFLGVSLYNANQSNNAQIAALNQQLNEAQQRLTESQNLLAREREERQLLASPQTAVFALTGTEQTPNAKARLVFDPKTGQAVLFVEGLPDAPQGKAYQIWWITDPKKPAPGHTFKTNQNGQGELRDQIPPQFTNASIFAVTVEPEGGSPVPTGSVILKTPA